MNNEITISLRAFILCLLIASLYTGLVILTTSLIVASKAGKGFYIENMQTIPSDFKAFSDGVNEMPKKVNKK